ncbi:MAG: hypothetical protein ACJ76N_20620 [Thermoanaerobaculia bacterium]
MKPLPDRRGCVHYGALAFGLFMAAFGVAISAWSFWAARGGFLVAGPRHIPDPSTAEVRSTPEPFVKMIREAREARSDGLQAFAYYCEGSFRVLLVISVTALIAALTTPGKPRFLRFADWKAFPDLRRAAWLDFGLAAGSLLLCAFGEFLARALIPDLSHPPVLPPDGKEVHRLLASEASKMVLAVRSSLFVGGISVIVFLAIFYRTVRSLWGGVRAERRRRQAETNALTVKQF